MHLMAICLTVPYEFESTSRQPPFARCLLEFLFLCTNFEALVAEIAIFCSSRFGGSAEHFAAWLATRPLIAEWQQRDVYDACLGRLPEIESDSWTVGYRSREHCADHITESLLSEEFRGRIIEILSNKLPWLRRVVFVHIPRTAGTSVQYALERGWSGPWWHINYSDDAWFDDDLKRLGSSRLQFMLNLLGQLNEPKTRLLVVGHNQLGDLLVRKQLRSTDEVFTVIREPQDIVISSVRYILDKVTSDSHLPDASDWRNWLDQLGLPWRSDKRVTVRGMLRSERFRSEYANLITKYLSIDGTASNAIKACQLVQCSILKNSSIKDYLTRKLDVRVNLGVHNSSSTDISAWLSDDDKEFILTYLCDQDLQLFVDYDEDTQSFAKLPK
jgi:hypothetical protein